MTELIIAELLKDVAKGTPFYTTTFGEVELVGVFEKVIEFDSKSAGAVTLDHYGKQFIDGECVVFPSREMRDWDGLDLVLAAPRKGELGIFWEEGLTANKRAIVAQLEEFDYESSTNTFLASNDEWYPNAIRYESPEQYLQFIGG